MWKQIKNTNYEVSNEGIVRNLTSKKTIKGCVSMSGYKMVSLHVHGKTMNKQVHRLVSLAFIDNPENKAQVNHIDKNKTNNHVSNLEWVTPKENMKHHYDNGGVKNNNQTYKGKFGKEHNRSVSLICNGVIYNGYSEASRLTGIGISTIHYGVKNNKPTKGLHFQLAKI